MQEDIDLLFPESRIILSLCDHSGEWSRPYREAGYDVRQIDLQDGQDVRTIKYPGKVYGLLMAPPCTVFCTGGAHLWAKRSEDEMLNGLAVVDACLRLVTICEPFFWALENPKGRLSQWLGPWAYSFQPYWFGDDYTKLTHLWGKFNHPQARGVTQRPQAGKIENAPSKKGRQNPRSVTPAGFARAFFEANP